MWKQAWRSYVTSLHPRNLRKAYDDGKLFWLLYWLIIYPTIIRLGNNESLEIYEAIYLTAFRFLPWCLMEWSDIGSKFLMTKMMFLSPMKEEERKEYMNCVLCVKIGVSLICSVLIDVICSLFYGFSTLKMMILLVMILSIGIAKYISLEAKIAKNKDLYYDALGQAQTGWHEGTEDPVPFIKYLLGTILAAYRDFEDRFALVETKLPAIETVRRATMNKIGRFTKQDIRELCPSLSISSIEGALRKLVASGELKREGSGKNICYYRLN